MRTLAIGDIHGCREAFRSLLEVVSPSETDHVVAVGDVVDRGSDSKGVIDDLIDLQQRTQLTTLIGNHEVMMLAVLSGKSPQRWLKHGGAATLDSYGFFGSFDVIPDSHREFLANLKPHLETERHLFVHANYDEHSRLSDLSGKTKYWRSLREHLPGPHHSGKLAVVGHTAQRDGQVFLSPGIVCVDTHCYGGKWLTALDLDSGQYWQANESGETRDGVIDLQLTSGSSIPKAG